MTVRRLIAVALAALAMNLTPSSTPPKSPVAVSELSLMHEARLRKLHLVRPDLISYPISFDAVC